MEQANSPCADQPVPNLEIDYLHGSTVVAKTKTDAHGVYVIDLAPGTYNVAAQTYMRIFSGPTRLTLRAGDQVRADYRVDNGMRVPVAQQ